MKKIGGIKKIVILAIMISSLFVQAKTININSSQDLIKILKEVNDGDTIKLKPGIYNGNFQINKSINIISENTAILTSNGNGDILTINASDVKIKGIIFYNSGKETYKKNSCIFIKNNKANISNSFFSECGFGVWIDGSSYNYITNNIFIGTLEKVLSDRGNTIHLYKTSNTIINNNFIINGRDGIYITNSKEVSIIKNLFLNTRFGVHYMFSNKCNVISNIISDSLIGIAIMYSKYVDLINNLSYMNINHGIFLRDIFYSRVIKNKSLYNSNGILLGSSNYNDIINNDIIKNNIGTKVYAGSIENLVYDNNFINNNWQTQLLDNKKLIWNYKYVGNFWSHYVGWDLDENNIGDKKFYVTNVNDWLVYYYPVLRIMFNSPSFILLQKIENQFPAFRKYSIIDSCPLINPIIW